MYRVVKLCMAFTLKVITVLLYTYYDSSLISNCIIKEFNVNLVAQTIVNFKGKIFKICIVTTPHFFPYNKQNL